MNQVIATKSPGKTNTPEKFPHQIGRDGHEFQPLTGCEGRGTEKGWAKPPCPKGK